MGPGWDIGVLTILQVQQVQEQQILMQYRLEISCGLEREKELKQSLVQQSVDFELKLEEMARNGICTQDSLMQHLLRERAETQQSLLAAQDALVHTKRALNKLLVEHAKVCERLASADDRTQAKAALQIMLDENNILKSVVKEMEQKLERVQPQEVDPVRVCRVYPN